MRKSALSLVVLVFGATAAMAQKSQPGYAFLPGSPKASGSNVVVPTAASPPEPGSVATMPVAPPGAPAWNHGLPLPGPIQAAPGTMPPPAGAMTGMAPMMMDGAMMGPGVGGYGAGYPLDPPSSFGSERMWFTARYLHGWVSRSHLSTPLVTVGSPADPHPGALGDPNTRIVFGDDQYQFGPFSGVQLEFGVNLNDRIYLEMVGMYFQQQTKATIASDSAGNPFIGRPIFNTLFGEERSYLTSSPGLVAGFTTVDADLTMFNIEANARYNVKLTPYLDVDGLLGYRRLQLEEDILITDQLSPITGSITFLGTPIGAPNTISDLDRFAATNQFNGVNTGMRFRWQSGFPWFAMNAYGKFAVGSTRQTMEIEGLSGATTAAGNQTTTGGVLALASNIGFYERTRFAMIPEGGVGMVFLPWSNVRFHVGYSATYWDNVLRPGDAIDRRVNPALVPTDINFGTNNPGLVPAYSFRSRSIWIQTLNFGLEFYY